ncbi:hypothetical protein D3C71_1449570 [compost metagenome]
MPRHRKSSVCAQLCSVVALSFAQLQTRANFYTPRRRAGMRTPRQPQNLEAKNEAPAPVTRDVPFAPASAFGGDRHGGCGPWRVIRRCGDGHLGRRRRERFLGRPRELGGRLAQHFGRRLCWRQHGSGRWCARSGLVAGGRYRCRLAVVSVWRKPDHGQLRAGQRRRLKRGSRVGRGWRRQRLELHDRHDRQGRQQHGIRDCGGSRQSARSVVYAICGRTRDGRAGDQQWGRGAGGTAGRRPRRGCVG